MEENVPKSRFVAMTIVFVIVLGLCLLFAWKVFAFYRQIQTGTLDLSSLSFAATQVKSSSLAQLAARAPGSGELATTDDPSLGNTDAPITIVEFADFGCPYSAEVSYVVRAIAQQYPNTVRVIYRDFPLPDLHPGADLAAAGGACAEEQGKFWKYHDTLFQHSGDFTETDLLGFAEDAGLDVPRFSSCVRSGKYTAETEGDLADGVNAGVRATPTFFINGVKVEGAIPFSVFTEIIHAFTSST